MDELSDRMKQMSAVIETMFPDCMAVLIINKQIDARRTEAGMITLHLDPERALGMMERHKYAILSTVLNRDHATVGDDRLMQWFDGIGGKDAKAEDAKDNFDPGREEGGTD